MELQLKFRPKPFFYFKSDYIIDCILPILCSDLNKFSSCFGSIGSKTAVRLALYWSRNSLVVLHWAVTSFAGIVWSMQFRWWNFFIFDHLKCIFKTAFNVTCILFIDIFSWRSRQYYVDRWGLGFNCIQHSDRVALFYGILFTITSRSTCVTLDGTGFLTNFLT